MLCQEEQPHVPDSVNPWQTPELMSDNLLPRSATTEEVLPFWPVLPLSPLSGFAKATSADRKECAIPRKGFGAESAGLVDREKR